MIDRDECREGLHNCTGELQCVNYEGTYRCEPILIQSCPEGTALNPETRQCVTKRQCTRGYDFNVVTLACEGKLSTCL